MAILHPRVAHNAMKMGYYPTDAQTMRGIGNLFADSMAAVKFLDPCCGTADALLQLADPSRYPFGECYGIELDEGRAATAGAQLHRLLTADALSSQVTPQSVDVLFLNPPYSEVLRDRSAKEAADRLERRFLSRFFPALKTGGHLIYIIPKGQLDEYCQRWLLTHFEDIGIYRAATDKYRQIVFTGRKSNGIISADKALMAQIAAWQDGREPWPTLPEVPTPRYFPAANEKSLVMMARDIDLPGLATLINEQGGLWQDFDKNFCSSNVYEVIRPLHDITDWHTGLLIVSGVVSGLVDNGKRCLLVRGRTIKLKTVKIRCDDNGEAIAEEHRDRFSTVIKAIDLSEGSATLGQIFDIV